MNGKFFPHINDIVLACLVLLFWCKKLESLSFISEATSELNTMAEHIVLPCIYLLPLYIGICSECNKHSSSPMFHKLKKLGYVRQNILWQSEYDYQ